MHRLLERMGTAMTSYQGIDDILDLILENLNMAVGASACAVFLKSEKEGRLVLRGVWGEHPRWSTNGASEEVDEGLFTVVMNELRPHQLPLPDVALC